MLIVLLIVKDSGFDEIMLRIYSMIALLYSSLKTVKFMQKAEAIAYQSELLVPVLFKNWRALTKNIFTN